MGHMAKDTITLGLGGDISLDDFAAAVARFRSLVDALTSEVGGGGINWIVTGLEAGSALATIQGIAERPEAVPRIEAVVRAYGAVGRALERNDPIPFSPNVAKSATQLRDLLGPRVRSVRFETAEAEAEIVASIVPVRRETSTSSAVTPGAVEGRIQTVSNRRSLRFTLYDMVDDAPISCYLREGDEDQLRNLWGRVVLVEGRVKRDRSGRPVSIREITSILPRAETALGAFRRARGVIPWGPGDPPPETLIRRARDA